MKFLDYIKEYKSLLEDSGNSKKIQKIIKKITSLKKKNKLILVGNGGSAASASHMIVDFTKQAKIKAINFNEVSLITAFANDYGYENYITKALEFYAKSGDIIIFISVSGNSNNLVNALKYSKKNKFFSIAFTGSNEINFLNKNSNLSIHIKSYAYNIVECMHLIFLTYIVDAIIGKKVYKVDK